MANTSVLGLVKPAYTDDADISDLNGNFDLIDAEAGRLRANFAPTYSTSSAYAVGDYVVYTGNLYRCTTAIGSGGENWTAGHWTQVAIGTEVKGLSDQIASYWTKDIRTEYFTSTTGYSYTGASITIPANTVFNYLVQLVYSNGQPVGIMLSTSDTAYNSYQIVAKGDSFVSFSGFANAQLTVYIFAKYANASANYVKIDGVKHTI